MNRPKKIWFTSDPHYFHNNVIKYCNRPYLTVDEMNIDLMKKWNEKVQDGDIVYCLGDFSLAFRPVEIYSWLLKGERHLIPGNHDFCHSYNKKSRNPEGRAKWIKKYEEHGWTVHPEQTTLTFPGVGTFNVCHHPYGDDNSGEVERTGQYQDKYTKWRPKDDGRVLLCGHIHEKWKTKVSDKGTLMVNVGVDAWDMAPVSLEEIDLLIEMFNRGEL